MKEKTCFIPAEGPAPVMRLLDETPRFEDAARSFCAGLGIAPEQEEWMSDPFKTGHTVKLPLWRHYAVQMALYSRMLDAFGKAKGWGEETH